MSDVQSQETPLTEAERERIEAAWERHVALLGFEPSVANRQDFIGGYRAARPSERERARALTAERDEALDLLEHIWKQGPRFNTYRLTDWLREHGRGPARAAFQIDRRDDGK